MNRATQSLIDRLLVWKVLGNVRRKQHEIRSRSKVLHKFATDPAIEFRQVVGFSQSRLSPIPHRQPRLLAPLRPNPFIAQANRSIRVGLAFGQPEVALRKLAGEAGDTIAQ